MHPFSDRSTNQDRPHASTFRQKYKSGHHMHPFSDRSTNQANTCMYFWTEVQIRPQHVCIFGQKYKSGHQMHAFFRQKYKSGHQMHVFSDRGTNQASKYMYSQTEGQIRPSHACYHRQRGKSGQQIHAFRDRSTKQVNRCMSCVFRQKYV
jgi:hypothetical protein